MASSDCCFLDIYDWIQNLPSIAQWKTSSISICLCSTNLHQPSLNLSVTKQIQSPTLITFSITVDFSLPISLWSTKPFKINPTSSKLLEEDAISNLLTNFIEDVLNYGSNKNRCNPLLKFPKIESSSNFKDIFNLAFLTLLLLICTYETPAELRAGCLNTLKGQLAGCQSRAASKLLMKHLGSNLEELWMRSINLAITNWIVELQAAHRPIKTPSPIFSYSLSTLGLWKIHLYCPVIAMDIENSSNPSADERLLFSLNYHQIEAVIQFNYQVMIRDVWVNFMLNIDNIRCDVIRLVNEKLMNERGVGIDEKHFPSRISLQLTPTLQTNILSVSVSKSSENPTREIEVEKSIEGSFDPPNSFFGLKVSAGETSTMNMKPWKFEQSVYGYSAIMNWFLHDSMDGREVFSSKASKISLLNPNAWFKDRYSSAYRPFTRQGGVIFAGDEYGERVWWKLDRAAIGKTIEWEIRGRIWLTYWPNKHRTFYNETRSLEFREILHLDIA